MKMSARAERKYHIEHINELHAKHTKLKIDIDQLTDSFLDGNHAVPKYKEMLTQLLRLRSNVVVIVN